MSTSKLKSPCGKECQGRSFGCRRDCEAFRVYEAKKAEEYAEKDRILSIREAFEHYKRESVTKRLHDEGMRAKHGRKDDRRKGY